MTARTLPVADQEQDSGGEGGRLPPRVQRELLAALGLEPFDSRLRRAGLGLSRTTPRTLQVNLGKLCNMRCRHCHVDAGPDRVDAVMPDAVFNAVLRVVGEGRYQTLDLTGGAPELHPRFRELVVAGVAAGHHVMDRNNLTVLLLPAQRDLPSFLAEHGVEVVASLPHPRAPQTDAQRGAGTWTRSIEALRLLNAVGYGKGDPRRMLTLVSNPPGHLLAGAQAAMERDWKTQLHRTSGVSFDRLFLLNNMPISRYLGWLHGGGQLPAYGKTLVDSFNPAAVHGLMCRDTVSVGWDGVLYDCDFNQMLELPIEGDGGAAKIGDPGIGLAGAPIVTGPHCYGCTAGAGSSCGGATVASTSATS